MVFQRQGLLWWRRLDVRLSLGCDVYRFSTVVSSYRIDGLASTSKMEGYEK